ncbi:MAG: serine/threonine-protein kinase [Polyangiaceae bacterium]
MGVDSSEQVDVTVDSGELLTAPPKSEAAPKSEAPPSAPPSHKGFSSSDEAFRVPCAFGRLLLLKLIARGGMGDVYLAATTGIEGAERPVIVKTVRRDHIHDGSFLARFLDEARVQSQLHHPGVAQVLEASTDDSGEPFVVVEYVEGRSLADVRQRAVQLGARIHWPEAVAISIEIAQALAHVHERAGSDGTPLGIVHRDLSPQNVMVGYSGEVKLIDFGTARGHNRRCHTVAGVVFAKPGYVAPEVARQQVGDGRIDVYALGIMLWELCAGRRFLTGDAQKHLEDAAAGRVVVPAIADEIGAPKLLDQVIARLTSNDPDARYTSATLAVTDLARILQEAPTSKAGERGVRGRVTALMKTLWSHEPARSRADFAKLLRDGRPLMKERLTPVKNEIAAKVAEAMNEDALLAGTPYRLVRKIGEGASGEVFEAEHVELGRHVAIKILTPEHGSAKDAVERFRREARAIAGLTHPNLCLLYDFGRALDGRVFLAMELLRGQTLEQYLRASRGMDYREAVGIAIEVTKALEAAHGAGVVHRDLKPANLFLQKQGPLKLVDFGVAMALSDVASQGDEQRQKGFAIFGTPEYMAPEQVAGEAVDGVVISTRSAACSTSS